MGQQETNEMTVRKVGSTYATALEAKKKRREERKRRYEELPPSEKKRYSTKHMGRLRLSATRRKRKFFTPPAKKQPELGEEGAAQPEGDSKHGNEAPGSSGEKGQGRGQKTRSGSENSEDSSEDESRDGSWASESEGKQLRIGRKARPLRQAVIDSSKRSKYADSEEGESSGSARRGRKKPRLEEETIYTQVPITRKSARAAAAKNKKIYAEDSDSGNQQDDGDQGVPDEDYNARQEVERPQGTHFLDPDFGGLEDMAMDSIGTLENCLETVLVEQSHDNSLGPPDLGPPEKTEDVLETDQNKDESSKETKDSEVSEASPGKSSKKDQVCVEEVSEGNRIETEAVVEGRQLRFGRKARAVPQYTKRKRRGRRGRSYVTAAEEADPQAEDSGRNNSEGVKESLQPAGDSDNTDCRVPVSAVVEEGSEQQSTKKGGSPPEPVSKADLSGEGVLSQKDNPDEIPADQDSEASPQKPGSEVSDPPKDKPNPSPGEKPPDSSHSDKSPDSPHSDKSPDPPQDDLKENDDTNCVPYGPKMATPTQADVEFFRSIIPTMAKFDQHQRAILKATVLSTLKDMLGEDIGVKLNTSEVLLSALPLPASP